MTESIKVLSAHDFLYGDRHKRFYPDIKVYLEGDRGKIDRLVDLLEQGKTALEICQDLKLTYRGDVWFATLLVYFHIRDGFVDRPDLDLDIPAEIVAEFPRCEAEWQAGKAQILSRQ